MKKPATASKRALRPKQQAGVASRYVVSPLARTMTTEEWLAEEARITELMRGGKVDRSKSVVEVMREMRR